MEIAEDADSLWAQERENIITKYEKGHRAGLPEDSGPEPVGIYSSIDCFGIVHETELPPATAWEVKQMRREITRKSKWMEMLGQWETYKNSTKLIDRVYKGIPMNIRGQVWSVLLNMQEVKSKNPRTYKVMKEKGKRSSEHIHQIDLDVSRTLRTHIFFRDRYGAKIPQPKWRDSPGAPRPSGACGTHITTQDHVASAKPEQGSSVPRPVLASSDRTTLCKGDRQAPPGPSAWFQRPISLFSPPWAPCSSTSCPGGAVREDTYPVGTQGVHSPAPAQGRPQGSWRFLEWNSMPRLPTDLDVGGPWFPHYDFEQSCWVRVPSECVLDDPGTVGQGQLWKPMGTLTPDPTQAHQD
ncbi:hypothetical protein H8959_005143 [Pygathrix nigripes]